MEVSATAARSSARPSPAPPSAGHNSQASSAGDGSSSSGTVPPVDPLADPLHLPLVSVPAVKPGGEAAQLPLPEPFAGQAWAEGLARVSGQVLGLVRAHVDPGGWEGSGVGPQRVAPAHAMRCMELPAASINTPTQAGTLWPP